MSEVSSLPIIDISPWLTSSSSFVSENEEKKECVCKDIKEACCQWGFFIITGLPETFTESIIPNAANQSRQFFASSSSSLSTKQTSAAATNGGAYGYFGMETESLTNENDNLTKKLPDLREAWSMGPVTPMSNRLFQLYNNNKNKNKQYGNDDGMYKEVIDFCYQTTPWPSSSSSSFDKAFQSSLTDFFIEASNIGRVVLQIVARCLDLPETYFQQASMDGENCNSARAIWYPKLKTEPKQNQYRCGPHTDSGVLTLLWTDGLGLEIQTNSQPQHQSSWIPIPKLPTNSLLINIGDLLQEASGHKWRSTPHRVLAPKLHDTLYNQDRLVLVLFLLLAADFPIPNINMTQGEYLFHQFQKWKQH